MSKKNEKTEYCCLSTLKLRGWTQKLIDELLPEPTEKRNPYYRSAAPMKLWDIETVQKAEDTEEFKGWIQQKKLRAQKIKESKQAKIDNLVCTLPKTPADAYPLARSMKRHFVLNVGGTNTGKTYTAIQDLKKAQNGVYLAPLRLLAMEIQDTLMDAGVKCSLLTGEEENIIPESTVMASTVEKLNINQEYAVAVIDECQMLGDTERGGAWTRAILGVAAEKVWLCMSENALSICIRLIEMCGDTYEVNRCERQTPLIFTGRTSLDDIQPYDALIVFSRKEVLRMAQALSFRGYAVSVIYGALPYSSRKEQVRRYNEGETNIIVSTDAIGMGLNLPIKRVLFAADSKYDGTMMRELKSTEIKQIAGRAGRYGKFNEGFVGVVKYTDEKIIERGLEVNDQEITRIRISFPESLVNYKEKSLAKTMKLWQQVNYGDDFRHANIEQVLWRVSFLEKQYPQLDKETIYRLSTVMFDNRNDCLLFEWKRYCRYYVDGDLKRIKLPQENVTRLQACERLSKRIDLCYSFCKATGIPIDLEEVAEKRLEISEKINKLLLEKRNMY